jgi:16S rRNA G966 N2-methylase RsmD
MFYDLLGYPIINDDLKVYSVPYMGSKRGIAIKLLKKMLDIKPQAKYFVDLFGGGGAMAFTASQIGLNVIYNELDEDIVDLIKYIKNRKLKNKKGNIGFFPDDFYKFINKEEFQKYKNENSIKATFIKICYSFGNQMTGYAYSYEKAILKKLIHNFIIYNDAQSKQDFNNYTNFNFKYLIGNNYKERNSNYHNELSLLNKNPDYYQSENIGRFKRLENITNINFKNITISNLDYKDVLINTQKKETIIYLDPPYRNTVEYENKINFNELDNFFLNLPYTAFLSEYNAPFKKIYEIEKTSLLKNNKNIIENLYINEK